MTSDKINLIKRFRGLPNFFGAFETYYTTILLPTSRPSSIAWIGSIQLFLSMLIGLFAGRLLDTGYARLVFVVGSFLEVFGMLMASVCTQYWQLLLSQGICVGIGSGLLGQTSLVVIPLYFKSRRMIAIGIAATGASLGTRMRMRMRMRPTFSRDWLTWSDSWNNLFYHDAKAVCGGRFWMGGSDPGFCDACWSCGLLHSHAAGSASEEAWTVVQNRVLERPGLLCVYRGQDFPLPFLPSSDYNMFQLCSLIPISLQRSLS